jgi:hypothetical protein
MPGVRFFLFACVFCLGIHFLVTDLAFFNFNAARSLHSKPASLRISDNDHQEDDFSKGRLAGMDGSLRLTLPLFNQPVYELNRAISPLFSPPKA